MAIPGSTLESLVNKVSMIFSVPFSVRWCALRRPSKVSALEVNSLKKSTVAINWER